MHNTEHEASLCSCLHGCSDFLLHTIKSIYWMVLSHLMVSTEYNMIYEWMKSLWMNIFSWVGFYDVKRLILCILAFFAVKASGHSAGQKLQWLMQSYVLVHFKSFLTWIHTADNCTNYCSPIKLSTFCTSGIEDKNKSYGKDWGEYSDAFKFKTGNVGKNTNVTAVASQKML